MSVEEWRVHIDSFQHLDGGPKPSMSEASFFNLEQAVMDIWLERRGG